MRCREVREKLAEYADDALPVRQRDGIAAHLRGCGPCRTELERLHQALGALNAASSGPAPDLWAGFQARLAAETPALACSAAREMLPAYLEGELEREKDRTLRLHLGDCPACAAEETLLARSLQALDLAPLMVRAPDLWPGFSSGLARTARCADVDAWLPAYLEGALDGPRALRMRAHLEECAACGAQEQGLQQALSVLDRAARPQEVDLWPAFAERLAREPARSRPNLQPAIVNLQSTITQVLRRPFFAPALGMAAAAAAAVFVSISFWAPVSPAAGPMVAKALPGHLTTDTSTGNNPPEVERHAQPEPGHARTAPVAATKRAAAPAGPSRRTLHVRVRRRRTPRFEGTILASRPVRVKRQHPTLMADAHPPRLDRRDLGNGGLTGAPPVAGGPDAAASPDAVAARDQAEVMPQVLEVAKLLASLDDAAARPFDASFHEQ